MHFRVSSFLEPFRVLKNRTFAKLYFAQTISLAGDAFTWVGLALLAYEIDPERSPLILATALTLRVLAFIIFSPFAGVLADRVERKSILYVTHFIRMAIVGGLPFVTLEWQIYLLVFLLNVFNAFFTPTYRAIIPQIVESKHYREAVGLSVATFQVLGVLGPALAGILAVWFGAREIFLADAASFVVAGGLILLIPAKDLQRGIVVAKGNGKAWTDVVAGIRLLFGNKVLRFALSIEFISAIAGAQVLVNTIGHVMTDLQLSDSEYGWAMAVFGIGAAVAAFVAGVVDKSANRSSSLILGALVVGLAVSFANYANYPVFLVLWVFAGLGQTLADMPSETLIGEQIAKEDQGKVYGSHFAFSHLWWAVAYPIAGFLGNNFPQSDFLLGGTLTVALAIIALLFFRPRTEPRPVLPGTTDQPKTL